ncbi:MAG: hypothetical protein QOH70_2456 [Blastocatellia bacterium]|nr:hypothetical protein [Blastocatellia bacterium]
MKKLIVVLCVLCIAGTLWAQRRKTAATQQSTVRRAFDMRENEGRAPRPAWLGPLPGERNSTNLREQRWRAWLTRIPHLVETKNIVSIKLAKAEKTKQWIVTLIDVDGKQTTLWCADDSGDGNIPVHEITPH